MYRSKGIYLQFENRPLQHLQLIGSIYPMNRLMSIGPLNIQVHRDECECIPTISRYQLELVVVLANGCR